MDALKQFLSAERYMLTTRADGQRRERWHVVTGTDRVTILTTEELDEALARLDACRHPWKEPGKVPAENGAYWWQNRYVGGEWMDAAPVDICDEPLPSIVSNMRRLIHLGGMLNDRQLRSLEGDTLVRFRVRWTPAPPWPPIPTTNT